jgi:hypothetical protein
VQRRLQYRHCPVGVSRNRYRSGTDNGKSEAGEVSSCLSFADTGIDRAKCD